MDGASPRGEFTGMQVRDRSDQSSHTDWVNTLKNLKGRGGGRPPFRSDDFAFTYWRRTCLESLKVAGPLDFK
jgi:hypothetical protein